MSLHDNALKTYHLYLKSHSYAPDWESEVDAFDEDEAVSLFQKQIDLDSKIIKENMEII